MIHRVTYAVPSPLRSYPLCQRANPSPSNCLEDAPEPVKLVANSSGLEKLTKISAFQFSGVCRAVTLHTAARSHQVCANHRENHGGKHYLEALGGERRASTPLAPHKIESKQEANHECTATASGSAATHLLWHTACCSDRINMSERMTSISFNNASTCVRARGGETLKNRERGTEGTHACAQPRNTS